jgi:hypothetical protein
MQITPELVQRVKRLSFPLIVMEAWIFAETVRQLPKDAIIGTVTVDNIKMRWNMFVVSEKFEKVAEGYEVPEIMPKIDGVNKKVELMIPSMPGNFMDELGDL